MKLPLPRVIDGSGATLFNPLDVAALESAYALLLARCEVAELAWSGAHGTDDVMYANLCQAWRDAVAAHEEACK